MRCTRKHAVLALALATIHPSLAAGASHPPKGRDCHICHIDASLTKNVGGKPVSLAVEAKKHAHSAHGAAGVGCTDCQTNIKGSPHVAVSAQVECATGHSDEQQADAHSPHSKDGWVSEKLYEGEHPLDKETGGAESATEKQRKGEEQ